MASTGDTTTTAATYQAIIIALVAAGILSTGLVSIVYKRRKRMRLVRAAESGMRMVILPDGRVFGVRDSEVADAVAPRRGERDWEKEPEIWDALLGEWQDEKVDIENDSSKGLLGSKGSSWGLHPISLAFPPLHLPKETPPTTSNPPPQNEAVQMTLLIAMPSPCSTPFPRRDRQPSVTSSSSSPSLHPHDNPDFLKLYHPESDADGLPPVEIATTLVPISSLGNDDDRRTLEKLRSEVSTRSGSERVPVSSGLRIERADGFRGRL